MGQAAAGHDRSHRDCASTGLPTLEPGCCESRQVTCGCEFRRVTCGCEFQQVTCGCQFRRALLVLVPAFGFGRLTAVEGSGDIAWCARVSRKVELAQQFLGVAAA